MAAAAPAPAAASVEPRIKRLLNHQVLSAQWMGGVERALCDPLTAVLPASAATTSSGDPSSEAATMQVWSRGGSLCSEAGSGKTLAMIALCNRHRPTLVIPADPADPIAAAAAADPRTCAFEPAASVPEAMRLPPRLFRSKATLVVCPSHVINQWADEIAAFAAGMARRRSSSFLSAASQLTAADSSALTPKVFSISAMSHLAKLSIRKLLSADFVLVSSAFMQGTTYRNAFGNPADCDETGVVNSTRHHTRAKTTSPAGAAPTADADAPPSKRAKSAWERARGELDPLDELCPSLRRIAWWRVIVDEAHEVLHGALNDEFDQIVSEYRWYVSGTPLGRGGAGGGDEKRYAAFPFLGVVTEPQLPIIPRWSRVVPPEWPAVADALEEARMLRFTIQTARAEATAAGLTVGDATSGFTETVVHFELTPAERAMYDLAEHFHDRVHMLQLCTHPQISQRDRDILGGGETQTLEGIEAKLVANAESSLRRAQATSKAAEAAVEAKEKKLAWYAELREHCNEDAWVAAHRPAGPCDKVDQFNMRLLAAQRLVEDPDARRRKESKEASRLTQLRREQREATAAVARASATRLFFSGLHTAAHDPCVICGSDPEKLAVTPCGHLFCVACIMSWLAAHATCPTCRATVRAADILRAKPAPPPVDPSAVAAAAAAAPIDPKLEEMRGKYGAKMAEVIRLVQLALARSASEKFLVFSQFDAMLDNIAAVFAKEGIQSVKCVGNWGSRQGAIRVFRSGSDVPVLLLSIEHAAAGANLTEAQHVLLVDQVDGPNEIALALERQAIGRAYRIGQQRPVEVVRFVANRTVEEELFKSRLAAF